MPDDKKLMRLLPPDPEPTTPGMSTGDYLRMITALGLRVGGQYGGQLLGGLVGAGAGTVAAPGVGTVAGAGVGASVGGGIGGGIGEGLAELVEKGTLDPRQISKRRVALEGGLGAIPGGWLISKGRALSSAGRGMLMGAGGVVGRRAIEDKGLASVDPREFSGSDWLGIAGGGVMGAAFSKLHGKTPTAPGAKPLDAPNVTGRDRKVWTTPTPKTTSPTTVSPEFKQDITSEMGKNIGHVVDERYTKPASRALRVGLEDSRMSTGGKTTPDTPTSVHEGVGAGGSYAVTSPEHASPEDLAKFRSGPRGAATLVPDAPTEATNASLSKPMNEKMASKSVAAERTSARQAASKEQAADLADTKSSVKTDTARQKYLTKLQDSFSDAMDKRQVKFATEQQKLSEAAKKTADIQSEIERRGMTGKPSNISVGESAKTPDGETYRRTTQFAEPPPPPKKGMFNEGGGPDSPDTPKPEPGSKKRPGLNDQRDNATVDMMVLKAQEGGYAGDPAVLKNELQGRLGALKDGYQAFDRSALNPKRVLQLIAKNGGLGIDAEKAQQNELEWLNEFANQGKINGVRGVVKQRGGLSLDQMRERLSQEPGLEGMTDLNQLFDKTAEAAIARGIPSARQQLVEGHTGNWWHGIGEPPVPEGVHAPPGVPEPAGVHAQPVDDLPAFLNDLKADPSVQGGYEPDLEAGGLASRDPESQPGYDPYKNHTPEEMAQVSQDPVVAEDLARRQPAAQVNLPQEKAPALPGIDPVSNPTPKLAELPQQGLQLTPEEVPLEQPSLLGKQAKPARLPKLREKPVDEGMFAGASEPPITPPVEPTPQDAPATGVQPQEGGSVPPDVPQGISGLRLASTAPETASERLSSQGVDSGQRKFTPGMVVSSPPEGLVLDRTPEGKWNRTAFKGEAPPVETPQPPPVTPEAPPPAPAPVEAPGTPDWVQQENSWIDKLKSERGAFDPILAGKIGLTGFGAATGAAADDENPVRGAVLGGAAGLGVGMAGHHLLTHPIREEQVRSGLSKVGQTLPQFQRFNLLTEPMSWGINAVAAPWGSGVMGGLEQVLQGNVKQGGGALKKLANIPQFGKDWMKSLDKVGEMHGITERGEMLSGEAPNLLQKKLAFPGDTMAAGDNTVRDYLVGSGISPEKAREITVTAEARTWLGKKIVEFMRGNQDNPNTAAKLMLPFARTTVNVLESSLERTPGLGLLVHLMKTAENRESGAAIFSQQALGAGVSGASYLIGQNIDPELVKQYPVAKLISNMAGQYGTIAAAGFAAGLATQQGKNAGQAVLTAVARDTPLPTTQTPMDAGKSLLNLVQGEPAHPNAEYPPQRWLPNAVVPGFLKDKTLGQLDRFFNKSSQDQLPELANLPTFRFTD